MRRFKSCCDVMESQIGGPIILKKYIKTMQEYMEFAENNKNYDHEEDDKHDEDEGSEESYKINHEDKEQLKQEFIKVLSL